jgi:hypothetical protein
MHCLRCHGLMVPILMKESSTCRSAAGWHCLICGETIDDIICQNRSLRPSIERTRPRLPGVMARQRKSKASVTRVE